MQRRTLLFFLIVVVLALGAAYIDFWPNANSQGQNFHGLNNPFTLKQGLDLQGGVSVLLLPDPSKHYDPATINSSIGDVRNQIEQRVNGLVGSGIGIGDQSVRIKTVSVIQGFATTLALGVAISMFTAIVVIRTFLTLLVATGKGHHHRLFGMALDVGGK